ncbi:MAG: polysaccharide deacetylase family protein [Lachnospiraceae bacterium]
MEDKTMRGMQEQHRRRKRINQMKGFIMSGIGIWIVVSIVLIVTLLVKMVMLENKLDKLSISMLSVEQVIEGEDKRTAALPKDMDSVSSIENVQQEAENGTAQSVPTEADKVAALNQESDHNQKKEGQRQKVYLTFDDGPSENTTKILDILKERNIKATFFVIGKEDEESKALYQRIVAEGHTLGMHSFTHKYSIIYDSLDAFSEDVSHLQSFLAEITGVEPSIMRFPGGSSNKVSNTDMTEFIRYLNKKGIDYYDWNVASGDATSQAYTAEELVQNVLKDVVRYDTSIVLMHDTAAKGTTVDALNPMIDQLQALDVELLPINDNTRLIQHIPADSID